MSNNYGVIYSLNCPKTGLVRYIGQTKQLNPIKRYYQHKYQWNRCNKLSHLNAWIKGLYSESLSPEFNIVEDKININDLNSYEKKYILLFKSIGANLTNSQEGGMVSYKSIKQKDEWKTKRLNTLKISERWRERSERHSIIMKNKYKDHNVKIGFRSLDKSMLKELKQKAVEASKQKICSIDKEGHVIKIFESAKDAAKFYNIKDSTHIIRVCKGKSKSGITHNYRFKYLNGKSTKKEYNIKNRAKSK